MTPFEREVLEEIAGLRPARPWGAAVGAAIDFLQDDGYVTRGYGPKLTEKGKAALEGKEDETDNGQQEPDRVAGDEGSE